MASVQSSAEPESLATAAASVRHKTACISCRSSRQKCDRLEPCSRCAEQNRTCTYPAGSNRGRKPGSLNKPDTVEKLLLRIRQSPVGDQVVKALIDSVSASRVSGLANNSASLKPSSSLPLSDTTEAFGTQPQQKYNGECSTGCSHAKTPKTEDEKDSPLDALIAAIDTAEIRDAHDRSLPQIDQARHSLSRKLLLHPSPQTLNRQQISHYLLSNSLQEKQSDWKCLAQQPSESIFKLDPTACDPIAARLIDENDAHHLFDSFFTKRNVHVGLLDPELHTPDFVYSTSFTLFSIICALGSAVSTRPRDQVINKTLVTVAEGNIQWSIAVSVRSIETVQAIILAAYWAPVQQQSSYGASWLQLTYAAHLAKELRTKDFVLNTQGPSPPLNSDASQRIRRNHERIWLHVFIISTNSGLISGRHLPVSWNEMPQGAFNWWRGEACIPQDRVICGIIESKGILLEALKEKRRADKSKFDPCAWFTKWADILEHVRNVRCEKDVSPSSRFLPLLAFNINHSALLLSTQARTECSTATTRSEDSCYERTVAIAVAMLDAMIELNDNNDVGLGLHNNQLLMTCHAVAEILQTARKNAVSAEILSGALGKARSLQKSMEALIQHTSATSALRLYASIHKTLADHLERYLSAYSVPPGNPVGLLGFETSSEWWENEPWPMSIGEDMRIFEDFDLSQAAFDVWHKENL